MGREGQTTADNQKCDPKIKDGETDETGQGTDHGQRTGKRAPTDTTVTAKQGPRRSKRHQTSRIHRILSIMSKLPKHSTIWTPTNMLKKNRRSKLTNHIEAIPKEIFIRSLFKDSKPLKLDNREKAIKGDLMENQRSYHSIIKIMNTMINPNDGNNLWHIEDIEDHQYQLDKTNDTTCYLKVKYHGGHKTWVNMEDVRLHDPFRRFCQKFIVLEVTQRSCKKTVANSNLEVFVKQRLP